MNRKLLTFSIAFLLTALLAFNTQTAYSSPISDLTMPSAPLNPPNDSEIINNSTMPNFLHSQPQTFEEQQLFWAFLNEVAGIKTSSL